MEHRTVNYMKFRGCFILTAQIARMFPKNNDIK